jgi:hypothetical protein
MQFSKWVDSLWRHHCVERLFALPTWRLNKQLPVLTTLIVLFCTVLVSPPALLLLLLQGQLLVTYTLTPKHRVYRLRPDGLAEPKWESDPSKQAGKIG